MKTEITREQAYELQGLARTASKRVAAQWPTVVQAEDLEQDVLRYLLEAGPGTLRRIFEEDQQTRQSFLIKVGHRIASKEQQDYDRFSGNYLYDTAEVRGLLERQEWLENRKLSSSKLDLVEGLKALADSNSAYWAAIIDRFFHEAVPASGSAEMKRIQRAIEALTEIMNRIGSRRRRERTEGPGTRKVISNSQAQFRSRVAEAGA